MKQTYGCHVVYEVGKGYVVLHYHLTIDIRLGFVGGDLAMFCVLSLTSRGRLNNLVFGLILDDQSMFAGRP